MSKRKFYRTTFTFVVLSDEPMDGEYGLKDLDYFCDQGPGVGFFGKQKEQVLSGRRMAQALENAGSEPGFFSLDEKGNDTDEA